LTLEEVWVRVDVGFAIKDNGFEIDQVKPGTKVIASDTGDDRIVVDEIRRPTTLQVLHEKARMLDRKVGSGQEHEVVAIRRSQGEAHQTQDCPSLTPSSPMDLLAISHAMHPISAADELAKLRTPVDVDRHFAVRNGQAAQQLVKHLGLVMAHHQKTHFHGLPTGKRHPLCGAHNASWVMARRPHA
jgi:hypothetical protein